MIRTSSQLKSSISLLYLGAESRVDHRWADSAGATESSFLHPPFHVPIWFMEHSNDSPETTSNLPARRIRCDGWTVDRQDKFLKALAACGCITDACRAAGMSRESAHNLYNDPRAKDFRAAFDAALDCAIPVLESGAWSARSKGLRGRSSTRASRSANIASLTRA